MHEITCDPSSRYPVYISDTRYPGIESDENKEITKTSNSPEKNGVTIRKTIYRALSERYRNQRFHE